MKNHKILTNQLIRIKAKVRDINGDLVDPQTIYIEISKPGDDSPTIYNTVTSPAVVKESVGLYYIDFYIDEPGRYKYSWFTLGYPEASWKGFFEAENARFV